MPAVTRRELLRTVSAATAIGAIGATGFTQLTGCDGDGAMPGPGDGSAVFEPQADALLVSVWSQTASSARVVVEAGGETIGTVDVAIDPQTGQGAVDLTGLAAGTSHTITITTDAGVRLGPHTAKTAPAEDDPQPVRIAVSADYDPLEPQFASDLMTHTAAAAPDLYVSIGDFPYTDDGPVAVTVDEYRARHAALRTHDPIRTLHYACGMRAIYDDHEYRNNWDAAFVEKERARYAAAMQAWDEFFPLRDRVGQVRYRSWRWGANVECFLLDCRRFRSADAAPDDARKTMLGNTQHAWLVGGLRASTAPFKLVFTSIPLDYGDGNDHWAAFTYARGLLFDAIANAQISGVLFVSGDQHWFASQQHAYGLRELQIGPSARGLGVPPDPQDPNVLFRVTRMNVGLIDVTPTALTISGLGTDGSIFYTETLTAAQLAPRLG